MPQCVFICSLMCIFFSSFVPVCVFAFAFAVAALQSSSGWSNISQSSSVPIAQHIACPGWGWGFVYLRTCVFVYLSICVFVFGFWLLPLRGSSRWTNKLIFNICYLSRGGMRMRTRTFILILVFVLVCKAIIWPTPELGWSWEFIAWISGHGNPGLNITWTLPREAPLKSAKKKT